MTRSIFPPPGSIKSIQRGTTTTNVTITPTNMAKSVLTVTGFSSSGTVAEVASLVQTATNTLTYNKGGLSTNPAVAWQLVEYY